MLLDRNPVREQGGRLDKLNAPDNLPNVVRVTDDIPIAQREGYTPKPKPKFNQSVLVGSLAAVGVVALVIGGLVSLQLQRSRVSSARPASATASSPETTRSQTPASSAAPGDDAILGHFPYQEASLDTLAPIVTDGSIKLRKPAAQAFQEMADAARQEGVFLEPISGFRSLSDQNYLFFGKKAERGQDTSERAKVSAPPGYSEHHTGYAIDIGDGNVPATHLSEAFENTAAYRWLKANAGFYSFELSFPKGNQQGVTYEPWHWRYVGDSHSLATFYKARTMQTNQKIDDSK